MCSLHRLVWASSEDGYPGAVWLVTEPLRLQGECSVNEEEAASSISAIALKSHYFCITLLVEIVAKAYAVSKRGT